MNFQDFFRNFIGLNQRHYNRNGDIDDDPINKFRNPPWGDDPDEDDEFDELYNDYRSNPSSSFGFNIFTGDVMQMHKFFEQQMNEMMKSFGSFGLGAFDFNEGFNALPEADISSGNSASRDEADIRDRYLKAPLGKPRFDTSQTKTDSDIDERVNTDGIGALFKKETDQERSVVPHMPRSFSKSFSSRVIINNNGRVEERVREWNSDGTETEKIVRKLGDQTHAVTSKRDKQGQLQQEEQLINIDQDSLSDFDKKWSNRNVPNDLPSSSGGPSLPSDPQSGSLGIFSPLFRLFS